ncbi:MAG: hypothetical protein RL630_1009 [Verrucomicrobiota bacterium]
MKALHLRLATLALVGLFCCLLAQGAEKSETPPPNSIGRDIEVSVNRGGECQLVLHGIAMPKNSVEFQIQKSPSHGSLGSPRRIDKDTEVYPYKHNGKAGHDRDVVHFKIKTGPEHAWGRLVAKIWIHEPPTRFVVEPEALDFGQVFIGENKALALKISNAGGGVLKGVVELSAPWSIEGGSTFELSEGQQRELQVVFSPKSADEQKGRLEINLGTAARAAVALRGSGEYRFEMPERVSSPDRAGAVSISVPVRNRSAAPLALRVAAEPPLRAQAALDLPVGGTANFTLELEKGHYSSKVGRVVVSDGLVDRELSVELPPPPALLEWEAGPVIDLGKIPFRNIPEIEAGLKNHGATTATVTLSDGFGGLVLAPSQARSFQLRSGETALVKLVWKLPEQSGEATAKLIAQDGGVSHEVGFKILVDPPAEVPAKAPEAQEKKDVAPAPPPRNSPKVLSKSEREDLKRRMPQDISYRLEIGPGTAAAVVNWKYSGPKPVRFTLERLVSERGSAGLEKAFEKRLSVPEQLPEMPLVERWVPVDSSVAEIALGEDGRWEGRVQGLQPGFHRLRIATQSPPDGKRTDCVDFPVHVGSLPWHVWVQPALWITLAMSLLYLARRKIARWFGSEE